MKTNKLKKILKKVRISHLTLLILLIVSNTFAWMIYANKVTTGIDVHVRTWNVNFTDNDGTMVERSFHLDVNNIYPGMDTYEETLNIENTGEIDGELSFTILNARILEDEYISVEGRASAGEDPDEEDLTSDELIDMFENDFPFSIQFIKSNDVVEVDESETFKAKITWPYESDNDELDTKWGNDAYHFKAENEDLSSISINVIVRVKQKADS